MFKFPFLRYNIPQVGEIMDQRSVTEYRQQARDADFSSRVLNVAARTGYLLLASGAEISRVEETIDRICSHYGVESEQAYVLSNGIFLTAGNGREKTYASVRYIPMQGSRFDRLIAVNQFSREVVRGKYTIGEAEKILSRIETSPGKSDFSQILASGIGSAAFSMLFGGSFRDALCAFVAGLILYVFVLKSRTAKKSKMVTNILGGMLVTMICYLLRSFGPGENLHYMVIGSVMPLIPGVTFISGLRDMAGGDYLSGSVRILDAILVFLSISIGVGVVTVIAFSLLGGKML